MVVEDAVGLGWAACVDPLLYVSDIGLLTPDMRRSGATNRRSPVAGHHFTADGDRHVTALPDVAITSSRSGAPVPVNVTVQSGSETTALRVPVPSL